MHGRKTKFSVGLVLKRAASDKSGYNEPEPDPGNGSMDSAETESFNSSGWLVVANMDLGCAYCTEQIGSLLFHPGGVDSGQSCQAAFPFYLI